MHADIKMAQTHKQQPSIPQTVFLWNPELQSSQSQTWLWTARVCLTEEEKVGFTRIKAQIWRWPDALHNMTYFTSFKIESVIRYVQYIILMHCWFHLAGNTLCEWTCIRNESVLAFLSLLDSNPTFTRKAAYLKFKDFVKKESEIINIRYPWLNSVSCAYNDSLNYRLWETKKSL